jgi:Ca2+/H+ antiporter
VLQLEPDDVTEIIAHGSPFHSISGVVSFVVSDTFGELIITASGEVVSISISIILLPKDRFPLISIHFTTKS